MKNKLIPFLLLLSTVTGPAYATDDNILISNLFNEEQVDNYWNVASSHDRQLLFNNLSRELAMAISHKNIAPGETLGLSGFEIGMDTTMMFVSSSDKCSVTSVESTCQHEYDRKDAWRVMDADHRLAFGNAIALPTLRLRKGLPFSTEAGVDLTYFSFSHQTALSGYGRFAIHEGMRGKKWRIVPDLAITGAATRFLGNEELDLSVSEWNVTIGWTFPVGGIRDSHVGTFSPFLGAGVMFITSIPQDPLPYKLETLEGVTGLMSNSVAPEDSSERTVRLDPAFRPWKFNIGMRVTSGIFRLAATVELAPASQDDSKLVDGPSATIGVGFIY